MSPLRTIAKRVDKTFERRAKTGSTLRVSLGPSPSCLSVRVFTRTLSTTRLQFRVSFGHVADLLSVPVQTSQRE
jgi:hypothetical protein